MKAVRRLSGSVRGNASELDRLISFWLGSSLLTGKNPCLTVAASLGIPRLEPLLDSSVYSARLVQLSGVFLQLTSLVGVPKRSLNTALNPLALSS